MADKKNAMDFTAAAPQLQVEQVPRVSPLARGHDRRQRQGKPDSPVPVTEEPPPEDGATPSVMPADPAQQIDLRI
jgi:hypothetical protein